jgi:hypothetical protein
MTLHPSALPRDVSRETVRVIRAAGRFGDLRRWSVERSRTRRTSSRRAPNESSAECITWRFFTGPPKARRRNRLKLTLCSGIRSAVVLAGKSAYSEVERESSRAKRASGARSADEDHCGSEAPALQREAPTQLVRTFPVNPTFEERMALWGYRCSPEGVDRSPTRCRSCRALYIARDMTQLAHSCDHPESLPTALLADLGLRHRTVGRVLARAAGRGNFRCDWSNLRVDPDPTVIPGSSGSRRFT